MPDHRDRPQPRFARWSLMVMERRALQLALLLAGAVPVWAGLSGVLDGAGFLSLDGAPAAADSHLRYLSGLLLAIGLLFWACVPAIERRALLVRSLTLVVVTGGLARAYGLTQTGWPGAGMAGALVMELAITPLICLWQARIARRAR